MIEASNPKLIMLLSRVELIEKRGHLFLTLLDMGQDKNIEEKNTSSYYR